MNIARLLKKLFDTQKELSAASKHGFDGQKAITYAATKACHIKFEECEENKGVFIFTFNDGSWMRMSLDGCSYLTSNEE